MNAAHKFAILFLGNFSRDVFRAYELVNSMRALSEKLRSIKVQEIENNYIHAARVHIN